MSKSKNLFGAVSLTDIGTRVQVNSGDQCIFNADLVSPDGDLYRSVIAAVCYLNIMTSINPKNSGIARFEA